MTQVQALKAMTLAALITAAGALAHVAQVLLHAPLAAVLVATHPTLQPQTLRHA